MRNLTSLNSRAGLACALSLVLAAAACTSTTKEVTKELAFEAVQDAVTNPLGAGAPLAGVILNSETLGREWLRRKIEAEGAMWEGRALTAATITERDTYERNGAFMDAARICLVSKDCDKLHELQKERRIAALQAEAAKGGSHSD